MWHNTLLSLTIFNFDKTDLITINNFFNSCEKYFNKTNIRKPCRKVWHFIFISYLLYHMILSFRTKVYFQCFELSPYSICSSLYDFWCWTCACPVLQYRMNVTQKLRGLCLFPLFLFLTTKKTGSISDLHAWDQAANILMTCMSSNLVMQYFYFVVALF